MATAETVTPAQEPARRISLEEYEAMARDGKFGPDDKLELLDGILVWKMVKRPWQVDLCYRILMTLSRNLPAGWHARSEAPVVLPGGPEENAPSMPEPDVTVRIGPEGTFKNEHPHPADVALVV